ncbi:MAG: TRAP transporter substrate-binding protein [Bacillota bacterium]
MKKVSLFLVVCLIIGVFITGCGSSNGEKDTPAKKEKAQAITISLAHTAKPGTAVAVTYDKFKELVEKKSNGQLQVTIYPNGQLGGDGDNVEAVKKGSVDIGSAGANNMASFTEIFLFADLPYVWDSIESSYKVWNSEIGDELKNKVEKELGMKALMFVDVGSFRNILNNLNPVKVPADMKGMKIRATASPIEVATLKAWGGNPTPVAWPETYMALEQKVVNAEHLQYLWMYTAKHHEAIDYITEIGAVQSVHVALMNKDKFNSLSPELQKVVLDSAKEAQNYNFEIAPKMVDELKKEIVESGVEVYVPTAEELEQWKSSREEVWKQFEDKVDMDFVKKVIEAQKN